MPGRRSTPSKRRCYLWTMDHISICISLARLKPWQQPRSRGPQQAHPANTSSHVLSQPQAQRPLAAIAAKIKTVEAGPRGRGGGLHLPHWATANHQQQSASASASLAPPTTSSSPCIAQHVSLAMLSLPSANWASTKPGELCWLSPLLHLFISEVVAPLSAAPPRLRWLNVCVCLAGIKS